MKHYKIIFLYLLFTQQNIYAQNSNHLYLVTEEDKYGLIDTAGRLIYSLVQKYTSDENIQQADDYYIINEVDRQGIIDVTGKINLWLKKTSSISFKSICGNIIYIYDSKEAYWNDFVNDYIYSHGFMNNKGQTILAPKNSINSIYCFSEGLSCVGKCTKESSLKYGYMDETGKMVIDFMFDKASSFYNGFALVKKSNRYSIIDKKGKIIKTFLADDDDYFEHIDKDKYKGYFRYKYQGKYGYVDISSQKIIPPQFHFIEKRENEDLIQISQKDKYGNLHYGYINKKGDIIINPNSNEFNEINYLGNNVFKIKTKDYRCGLMNASGKIIVKPSYEDFDYINGMIIFRKELGYPYFGAMDLSGNILIKPNKYAYIYPMQKGYFFVAENLKENFYRYSIISTVSKKTKEIYSKTNTGFYMKKLTDYLWIIYDNYSYEGEGKSMVVNNLGDVIIPLTSDLKIYPFEGQLALVTTNQNRVFREGYINRAGKFVWPLSKHILSNKF